jgi:FkbM family methyltransferase
MKIAFIDVLGLCYDGSTLSKRGLGGSESAIILMAKELAKIGFSVTVFNDCESDNTFPGFYDQVEYLPLRAVENKRDFDIVVASRSVAAFMPHDLRRNFKTFSTMPNFDSIIETAKYKVLWMHDTFCDGDEYLEHLLVENKIDRVFTLSDFHTNYVSNCEHGNRRMFEIFKRKIFQTRNGMTLYKDWVDITKKDPNLFVYNASVTKGMIPLVEQVWPKLKARIPEAKLTVIGGYYKFRENAMPDAQEQKWHEMVSKYSSDINFTGIITQKEISGILAEASFMLYPSAFPETFGISTLESLAYNTPLITCNFGALEETAIESACYKIHYPIEPNVLFPHINTEYQVNHIVEVAYQAWANKYLHQQKMNACNVVKPLCTWDTVAIQWKQHFYRALGEYLPVSEFRKVNKLNARIRKVFGRRILNEEEKLEQPSIPFRKISVITPVYNAEKYIEKCIRSVAAQDYNHWEMWIIDDASTDNTVKVIKDTLASLPSSMRINLIENTENMGAVHNQVKTIYDKVGDDIVMLLDGDDWLINDPSIFNKYNNIYADGAEFTYGSCWSLVDSIPLIAQEYPPEIKKNKSYKKHLFNWNMPYTHLRTFLGSLMHGLLHDKGYAPFMDENRQWLKAGGDTAVFYSLIEYADPDKVICVPDVVYVYNDTNPLNDYKVNGEEQTRTANKVLGSKKKRILIAIPCKNDIEADTFKSIYDLKVPEGYETEFQYFYGYAVDQVRNLIAHWAINGNYDYLLAIDHDMVFPSDTLEKLLAADKDVVTAVYRQRLEPMTLEVYDHDYRNVPYDLLYYGIEGDLVQIGACGFGCVLVKKKVFQAIPYPQFVYHQALTKEGSVSEDVDFCKKARDAGFTIWCDKSIRCVHLGGGTFEVPTPKNRLQQLSELPLLPTDHINFLKTLDIKPKVVYDIGACVLHWTTEARRVWPEARFIAFEAMDEVKSLYESNKVEYCVGNPLYSQDGLEVEFYENTFHPGGNSLYRENPELSPRAEELFKGKKITRITRTLDSLVKEVGIPLPDLIKMDIQGAELEALKGATETLKHCNHLILELQHKDYNIGAPKCQEVIDYLASLGFENKGMFCGSALEVDGDYYFKRTTY